MSSDSDKVKKLLQSARNQMQQGAREEALKLLRDAQRIDPSNAEIIERISSIEREITAMEKFNRTRSSRAHTAGRTISSTGFVEDCLRRSGEAFEAGDEVRALQELERARRHDPDNDEVRRRIRHVRRSVKVNSLADLVTTRLRSGDPGMAVENIRRIFKIWPAAPILDDLIRMAEEYREAPAPVEVAVEPMVSPVVETEAETITEPVAVLSTKRDKTPPPTRRKRGATVAVPGEKRRSAGRKAGPAVVAPAEEKKEKKSGNRLWGFVAVFLAALVITALIVKFVLPGDGDEPEPVPVATRPYTQTMVIPDLRDVQVMLDGRPIGEGTPGVYMITDSTFGRRTVQVSAAGMETLIWEKEFGEGMVSTDTLRLDSLGTSIAPVTLSYTMPEGVEDPGIDAVSFTIDGEPLEGFTDSIPTGMHVFQAQLEGFRTMPESVLVVDPAGMRLDLTILAAQQSQIVLQLSGDTPGNASFFVDGSRVATGRRVAQVLPFGTYSLRVSMEGRDDWTATINLGQDGYSRTVTLTEQVLTGMLLVGPEPWSDVYVDGTMVGTTPFGGVELEAGPHVVRLSNPDFQDDVRTIDIVEGENTAIQFAAVPVEEVPEEIPEELPVSSPFALQQTTPSVPSQAQARGDLHGYVTLAVRVGTDGSVMDVQIVNDPLGLGCGQAAQDAVRNWVFSPAMQGGEPVEVTTNVQVRFDID